MPSQFLKDLQADVEAGRVRTVSGEESMRRWQEFCALQERVFDVAAEAIAAHHGFDYEALRAEAGRCMGAIRGTRAAEMWPLWRRAAEIAWRKREAA